MGRIFLILIKRPGWYRGSENDVFFFARKVCCHETVASDRCQSVQRKMSECILWVEWMWQMCIIACVSSGVVFSVFSWGGVIRRPLIGLLLYQLRITDEYGEFGGMRFCRETRSNLIKRTLVPLCSSQIPHDLIWDRTQVVEVWSRRLIAWAMARPKFSGKARMLVSQPPWPPDLAPGKFLLLPSFIDSCGRILSDPLKVPNAKF
jgi:hypothetical protein